MRGKRAIPDILAQIEKQGGLHQEASMGPEEESIPVEERVEDPGCPTRPVQRRVSIDDLGSQQEVIQLVSCSQHPLKDPTREETRCPSPHRACPGIQPMRPRDPGERSQDGGRPARLPANRRGLLQASVGLEAIQGRWLSELLGQGCRPGPVKNMNVNFFTLVVTFRL